MGLGAPRVPLDFSFFVLIRKKYLRSSMSTSPLKDSELLSVIWISSKYVTEKGVRYRVAIPQDHWIIFYSHASLNSLNICLKTVIRLQNLNYYVIIKCKLSKTHFHIFPHFSHFLFNLSIIAFSLVLKIILWELKIKLFM